MGIRGGDFMEGGMMCVQLGENFSAKKKVINVIGEKPDICCCWTVLGSSFFFLSNDAIKFQED